MALYKRLVQITVVKASIMTWMDLISLELLEYICVMGLLLSGKDSAALLER